MRIRTLLARVFAAASSLRAAAAATTTPHRSRQCNPLGGQGCLLPWPSMAYCASTSTTPTGLRLALPIGGDADQRRRQADRSGAARSAGTASRRPARCSRCSRTASRRDSLPSFKDPDASLAAGLADRAARHRHRRARAVLRRGRRRTSTDPLQRALIIRPLARLHDEARTTRSRSATRSRPPTAADRRSPPASPRCATARTSTTRSSRTLEARTPTRCSPRSPTAGVAEVRARARVGLRHRVRRRSCSADLTDDARRRAPRDRRRTARTCRSPRPRSRRSPASLQGYVGTFKSPNFLTDGENDDSIMTRGADGAADAERPARRATSPR